MNWLKLQIALSKYICWSYYCKPGVNGHIKLSLVVFPVSHRDVEDVNTAIGHRRMS